MRENPQNKEEDCQCNVDRSSEMQRLHAPMSCAPIMYLPPKRELHVDACVGHRRGSQILWFPTLLPHSRSLRLCIGVQNPRRKGAYQTPPPLRCVPALAVTGCDCFPSCLGGAHEGTGLDRLALPLRTGHREGCGITLHNHY